MSDLQADQNAEIMKVLGRLDERTEHLVKLVEGDGQPGLVQKIEDLQASKNRIWGIGATVTFLGGVAEWLFHRGGGH